MIENREERTPTLKKKISRKQIENEMIAQSYKNRKLNSNSAILMECANERRHEKSILQPPFVYPEKAGTKDGRWILNL